eukprot:gene30316-35308_t
MGASTCRAKNHTRRYDTCCHVARFPGARRQFSTYHRLAAPVMMLVDPPRTEAAPLLPDCNLGGPTVIMTGQAVNLSGWRLTNSDTSVEPDAKNLWFGWPPCDTEGNVTVKPAHSMTIYPKSQEAPCGYTFELAFRDEVNLFQPDKNGGTSLTWNVKWGNSEMGSAIRRMPDGVYRFLPENKPILDVMKDTGSYSIFLEALQVTGLAEQLAGASDPDYQGPPGPPVPPERSEERRRRKKKKKTKKKKKKRRRTTAGRVREEEGRRWKRRRRERKKKKSKKKRTTTDDETPNTTSPEEEKKKKNKKRKKRKRKRKMKRKNRRGTTKRRRRRRLL